MADLIPIAPQHTPCKCCGEQAALYGVVDFNRNCETLRGNPLPPCGVPVYYHRCPRCGFLFTIAFDHWTPDDFLRHIYNEQYILVDPDYRERRPTQIAEFVSTRFGGARERRVLDYGGGNGLLAELLRGKGFRDIQVYDPFVPQFSTPPSGKFDLILCFEVIEHSPDPRRTITEMTSLLSPTGAIFASTLFQPPDIQKSEMTWWYIGPRNGHVSFLTSEALAAIAKPLGYRWASAGQGMHVIFREVPDYARQLFGLPQAPPGNARDPRA